MVATSEQSPYYPEPSEDPEVKKKAERLIALWDQLQIKIEQAKLNQENIDLRDLTREFKPEKDVIFLVRYGLKTGNFIFVNGSLRLDPLWQDILNFHRNLQATAVVAEELSP